MVGAWFISYLVFLTKKRDMKNFLCQYIYAGALSLFLIFSGPALFSQVVIDQTLTVEELVNDVLLGDGLTAFNITFNGSPASDLFTEAVVGFSASNTAFPISNGVALVTGPAHALHNLNNTNNGSYLGGLSDDPDLVMISGQPMNDCTIIEFDFIATSDTFLLDYIFTSTEYPGYTCTQYNDAFGIFLSGPGIDGPFTDGAENIALIPDSDIPVAINSVNGGEPTGQGVIDNCLNANPNFQSDAIYYFDNNPPLDSSIAFPGHTHMFSAFAELEEGLAYHFKFAIGDASDAALNSGVIMRAGSANSETELNGITLQVNTENIEVDPEGIFVAGTWNYFQPEPMTQISENVYAITSSLPAFMNISYKFFNGTGANASELVPEDCSIESLMPDGSRVLTTMDEPIVLDPVCFGTCDTCPESLSSNYLRPQSFHVFPNPSSGQFHLQSPSYGYARIQAFNSVGSMVLDKGVFLNQGETYAFEIGEPGLYKMLISFEREGASYQSTVVVN
jgi:hypothetical protein